MSDLYRGAQELSFHVAGIPIFGDLILAPMAGFSDQPYRALCREFGSAMSYTEFVSAHTIAAQRRLDGRIAEMLRYRPEERPIVFQIFGSDEETILRAAKRIEALGPDMIDLNMGCPARRVTSGGSGASLLRDPARVGRLFAALSRHLSVPVSGKIRLGWDQNSRNHVDVARAMAENGAALVAVHARTRDQGYEEPADWDAIAEVKQAVAIPVVGNGDALTVADIERMKAHTGCDAVMIGRGAMGHPWIFQRRDRHEVSLAERIGVMRRHAEDMVAFYGAPKGLVLMRKHITCYLQGYHGIRRLRHALLRCEDLTSFHALLDELARMLGGPARPEPSPGRAGGKITSDGRGADRASSPGRERPRERAGSR
ncbi:MAG: tRNA dihydrouridine synthase DusB [Anaerolineae bacterium]